MAIDLDLYFGVTQLEVVGAERRQLLGQKLEEYRGRRDALRHPGVNTLLHLKIYVLESVLRGMVTRSDLYVLAEQRFRDWFNPDLFQAAWAIVAYYVLADEALTTIDDRQLGQTPGAERPLCQVPIFCTPCPQLVSCSTRKARGGILSAV